MIVNTGVMFREVDGKQVPGFILMSNSLEEDLEKVKHRRLEFLLDLDSKGQVFLNVSVPDLKIGFARSQALPKELLEQLTKSLSHDPSNYHIGICPGDEYEKSVAVKHGGDDPLDPTGQTGKACHLMDKGAWEEAADLFEEIRNDRPWVPGVRTFLGRCLAALGNDADAERAYLAEIDKLPTACLALNNLGILYKRRGWLEHAFDCFIRALMSCPNHYEGLINFSTVLFYFGDLGGVRYCLARAMAVNSEGGLVERSLAALADKLGMEITSLRDAVKKRAESFDLSLPFQLEAGGGKKDLKKQEAYRCFVEEAFRDGRLETWEREVLSAAARILKIDVDLQCRIVVDTQKQYWQDNLAPDRALDKVALMKRLAQLANRDGVVKEAEQDLLERVSALLKVPLPERAK